MDGDTANTEVAMKKSIFIMLLVASQAACTTPGPASGNDGVLLSFQELANEITVGSENPEPIQVTASTDDMPLGTP
jgi:hypothetical protein